MMKKLMLRMGLVLGGLVAIVALALFIATREAVLRALLLPRLAAALQTPVTVEGLRIDPFSTVEIRGLRLGAEGERLIDSSLFRLRYGFADIVRGRVEVREVRLDGTTLHLVRRADGTLNLPSFPAGRDQDDEDDDAVRPEKHLRLSNVAVSGLSVLYSQFEGPGQPPMSVRLADVSLFLPELAAGGEGTMALKAKLDGVSAGTVSGVRGTVNLDGKLGIDRRLSLTLIDLDGAVTLSDGVANGIPMAGRVLRLRAKIAGAGGAWRVDNVVLSEEHHGRIEATLTVRGEAQQKPSARLELDVLAEPLEAAVLNLLGALAGDLSVGEATARYAGRIVVQSPQRFRKKLERNFQQPWTVTSSGTMAASGLAPRSARLGLPEAEPFDASFVHDAEWSTDTRLLQMRRLEGRIGRSGADLLSLDLSRPFSLRISPDGLPEAAGDAAIRLRANGFDLAAINAFLPAEVPLRPAAGRLSGDLDIGVAGLGAAGGVRGRVALEGVRLRAADGADGAPFAVDGAIEARLAEGRRLLLDTVTARLHAQGITLAALAASGSCNPDLSSTGTARLSDLSEALLGILPASLAPAVPGTAFAASAEATWSTGPKLAPITVQARAEAADLKLPKLAGEVRLALTAQTDLAYNATELTLRQAAVAMRRGETALATADVSGTLRLSPSPTGSLRVVSDLIDLDALQALLAPPAPAVPTADGAAAPKPAASPTPAALPGLDLAVEVECRRVILHGLPVRAAATAVLSAAALRVSPLVLSSPGGEIRLEADLKPSGDAWAATLGVNGNGEAAADYGRLFAPGFPAEVLRGTSFSVRTELTAATNGSRLTVGTLAVNLGQPGQPVLLSLTLTEPLIATVKDGKPSLGMARVALQANRFPMAILTPLVPAKADLKVNDGLLDAALAAALRADPWAASAQGRLALAGLALTAGGTRVQDVGVELTVTGEADAAGMASVPRLELLVRQASAEVLRVSGRANLGPSTGGQASLDVRADAAGLLQAAGAPPDATARLRQAAIVSTLNIQVAPSGKPITVSGTATADPVRLADAEGRDLPPWKADLAWSGTLEDGILRLGDLLVTAATPGQTMARVALQGTVAVPPTKGRTELTVAADPLDLSALLKVVAGGDSQTAGTPSQPKAPPAQPGTEPGPIDTGEAAARVDLTIRNLRYGEIQGDTAGVILLERGKLTADPMGGTLNGAPWSARLGLDLTVQGFAYEAKAALSGLSLAPVLATFAPQFSRNLSGALPQVSVDVQGRGATMDNLKRQLAGRIEIAGKDLTAEDFPGQAAFARRWNLPELERVVIDQADLRARIDRGAVIVDTFRELSAEHMLDVNGRIGMDERLALDVTFGLAGGLLARANAIGAFREVLSRFRSQGDYAVSPVAIPLKGTVSKPELDTRKFLADVAMVSVVNALPSLLDRTGVGTELRQILPGLALPGGAVAPSAPTDPAPRPRDRAGRRGAGEATNVEGTAEPAAAKSTAPPANPEPAVGADPTAATAADTTKETPAPAAATPDSAPAPAAVPAPVPADPTAATAADATKETPAPAAATPDPLPVVAPAPEAAGDPGLPPRQTEPVPAVPTLPAVPPAAGTPAVPAATGAPGPTVQPPAVPPAADPNRREQRQQRRDDRRQERDAKAPGAGTAKPATPGEGGANDEPQTDEERRRARREALERLAEDLLKPPQR